MNNLNRFLLIVFVLLALAACTAAPPAATQTPTAPPPSPTIAPATPAPTLPPSPTAPPANTSDPNLPPADAALGSTWVRPLDGMTMVFVPAGEFIMGTDTGGEEDEAPQHTVFLDAFWIDLTEVTNAMFAAFVQATGSKFELESDPTLAQHPVARVDWQEALAYCQWAGANLPSEAQWEKAARSPDGRIYPWGNDPDPLKLNAAKDEDGWERTAPVGSFPAGASLYGALDMAGNVWEWVLDRYAKDYYSVSPPSNPPGPDKGANHVLRGGSWRFTLENARASLRSPNGPQIRGGETGFRCVWETIIP